MWTSYCIVWDKDEPQTESAAAFTAKPLLLFSPVGLSGWEGLGYFGSWQIGCNGCRSCSCTVSASLLVVLSCRAKMGCYWVFCDITGLVYVTTWATVTMWYQYTYIGALSLHSGINVNISCFACVLLALN